MKAKRRKAKDSLARAIKQRNHERSKDAFGDCDCCGQNLPICEETGMCYPCTTGDASTLMGDL